MTSPKWFLSSFNRTNLKYEVKAKKGKAGALQEIKTLIENYFCDKKTGKFQSGIVYCLSQKECNDTAEKLSSMVPRLTVRPYHAGLTTEERSSTQQAWIQDKVKVSSQLSGSNTALLMTIFLSLDCLCYYRFRHGHR